jgi:hypothetical protein
MHTVCVRRGTDVPHPAKGGPALLPRGRSQMFGGRCGLGSMPAHPLSRLDGLVINLHVSQ